MVKGSTLYVHCGLHKTGSTSLQAALRWSESGLREAGFIYPLAGSAGGPAGQADHPFDAGHHHIAWYAAGDRRFRRQHFNVEEFLREVQNTKYDCVLSSEDFESILANNERIFKIKEIASAINKNLVFVVYIRNQIEYFESLFLENIKHGQGQSFVSCSEQILARGRCEFKDWINRFDYEEMMDGMAMSQHGDVIFRNYHALVGASIVADFAAVLGLGSALQPWPDHLQANRRDSVAISLARFYANRAGRQPDEIESARIRALAPHLAGASMSLGMRSRFVDRFAEGNLRVCARWGLDTKGLDMGDQRRSAAGLGPSLEEIFSFETQCLIADGCLPGTTAGMRLPGWASGLNQTEPAATTEHGLRGMLIKLRRLGRWWWSLARTAIPGRFLKTRR